MKKLEEVEKSQNEARLRVDDLAEEIGGILKVNFAFILFFISVKHLGFS